MADSISTYGHAKWWIHPLSIIGLYPFSSASALPFYLSGISQVSLLPMGQAIWVSLLVIGIFSSFTAYLMAGVIRDDKIFKFITALAYSTSMGLLILTTWSASTRGLFLVFLPLFIYFLIKIRLSKLKYILLTVVLFIFLLATHNLFYFLIPIISGFVVVLVISKIKIKIKSSNYYVGVVLLILFVISYSQFSVEEAVIDTLIFNYARYIGVLGIFAMGGFIFLLFKNNKTFEESFTILVLLFLSPLINIVMYSKYFMLPFAALLLSYGITNLIRISQNRKCALFVVVIFIVLSIGVAEFYQSGRTNFDNRNQYSQYWAEESTVNAGMWTKLYTNKLVFVNEALLSRRILAYSGASMLSESSVVYPIQDNLRNFTLSRRSPFTKSFYSEGPYHVENQSGLRQWAWYKLRKEGLEGRWGWIAQALDIQYLIKNEKIPSIFSNSPKLQDNDKVFDNGDVSIWNFRY